jgi:hypothetical protein
MLDCASGGDPNARVVFSEATESFGICPPPVPLKKEREWKYTVTVFHLL